MTDDVILISELGTTNLQAFTNTVAGKSVKAEAQVQVDLLGVPVPRGSSAEPVRIDPTGTTTEPVRGVTPDNILASGLNGIPIIGWDVVNLNTSLLPINNGTIPVSGTVGIGGSLTTTIANTQANNQQMSAPGTFAFINNTSGGVGVPGVEITGTWTGTLVFEVQAPFSATWYAVSVKNLVTGVWVSSITANGFFQFPMVEGVVAWRVRASVLSSGTAVANFSQYSIAQTIPLWASKIAGAVPPEAVYIGGSDGVNLHGLSVKNANPLTTDYGAFIRTLFQQLPGSALPSHTLWMGASDATNLQGLLVESAANPNLFTAIRQGSNQLGINASNQVAIQNPPNLDTALSTRLADAKFPSTAALADATTNPTLTAVQDYQMLFNGSTWDRRRSSGVTGMAGIGGDTASAASDAGNPVKIGGVANTGLPTAVTTGQRANLLTDVYGRPRVVDERPKLLGMYYAESGNITVLATAHTSLQGFMWLSNTSATVKVYIRSIGFVWSGTAATAFPTSPRITVERVTFTGTPSGAAITPAKRDSTDAANTATLNTVSTGLTLTAGAVIESFVVGSVLTAVGAVSVPEEMWQPKDDDGLIVLRQNEGVVIRQPDAGTAADTRKIVMTLSWEER